MNLADMAIHEDSEISLGDIDIVFDILRPDEWVALNLKCKDKGEFGVDIFSTPSCIVKSNDGTVRVFHKDGSGGRYDISVDVCTKTGVHYDEVEAMLKKLRGAVGE